MNIPVEFGPGKKSKVTAALVMRVVGRVENGIPVKIAIAGEGVTLDAYQQYLRERPKLEALQDAAKRKFLERAVNAMLDEEKPGANYRWLLEHCHPDLLARPGDGDDSTKPKATALGLPEHMIEQMREHAKRL